MSFHNLKTFFDRFSLSQLIITGFSAAFILSLVICAVTFFGIIGIVKSYEVIVNNNATRTNQVELTRILDNFNFIYQVATDDLTREKQVAPDHGMTLMQSMLDIDTYSKEIMKYIEQNNFDNKKQLLANLTRSLSFAKQYKSSDDINNIKAMQTIGDQSAVLNAMITNDILPLLDDAIEKSTEQAKSATNTALWMMSVLNLLILGLMFLLFLTIRSGIRRHRAPIIHTVGISSEGAQKVSQLAVADREAMMQIREIFTQMNSAFDGVTISTKDSTVGIQKITESTEKTVDSLKKLSNQALQIFESLNRNQEEIKGSEAHLVQLRNTIGESTDRIQSNVAMADILKDKVANLTKQVEGIEVILQTISNIKDQTTLLSLNAGIEAARAGEQGRGFGVLAQRIRMLAAESGESTSEIQVIINEIRLAVTELAGTMAEVIDGVKESAEEIQQVNEEFNEVRKAYEKVLETNQNLMVRADNQLAASREIEDMSEMITAEAEQISAATEEVYASMEELTAEIETVLQQVLLVDNNIQRTSEIAVNQELLAKQVTEHVSKI